MKGLNIGIIGVGAAGCNIANEFARAGYKTIVINTSSTDTKKLDSVPKANQLIIPLGNIEGAGKDPNVGRMALEERIEDVYGLIENVFGDEVDKLFVCGGFGGGTGSGMLPTLVMLLAEQLEEREKTVGAICTLPSKVEGPRVEAVALDAFSELSSIEQLTTVFMIDNQKATQLLGNAGIKSKYQVVNENVVRLVDIVNEYSTKASELAFDSKDLDVALRARGCSIIVEMEIENIDELKNEMTLATLLKDGLKKSIFADTDLTQSRAAVILLDLPEGASAYVTDKSLEKAIAELGNPFDRFYGIYENESENSPKKMGTMTVLVSGLQFPDDRLVSIEDDLVKNESRYVEVYNKSANQKYESKAGGLLSKLNNKSSSSTSTDKKKTTGGQSTLDRLMAKKGLKNKGENNKETSPSK